MRSQCWRAWQIVVILFALASAAFSETLSTTTCPGAGCVTYQVDGKGTTGIQITGTFVGTLTFTQTIDGSNFVSWSVLPNGSVTTVTSTTSTGFWIGSVAGVKQVRVAFTAFTSGTAVVSQVTSNARNVSGSGSGLSNLVQDGDNGIKVVNGSNAQTLSLYSSATNNQFIQFVSEATGNLAIKVSSPPPPAPTLNAVIGGGSCTSGSHRVVMTYVTLGGETTQSDPLDFTCTSMNGQAFIIVPVGNQFTSGRNLYVSKTGTTTPLFLVGSSPTISSDTTTQFNFDIADGSLSATTAPTTNTALNTWMRFVANGNYDAISPIFKPGIQLFPDAIASLSQDITFVPYSSVYTDIVFVGNARVGQGLRGWGAKYLCTGQLTGTGCYDWQMDSVGGMHGLRSTWKDLRWCASGATNTDGCTLDTGIRPSATTAGIIQATSTGTFGNVPALGSFQGNFWVSPATGSAVASGATIAPTVGVIHISGTTTIDTITVPAQCAPVCRLTVIPDGIFALSTMGNIGKTSVSVVGQVLELIWDGTKWYPSY